MEFWDKIRVRDLVTGGSLRVVWSSRLERGSLAGGGLDRSVMKNGCLELEWPRQGCTNIGSLGFWFSASSLGV